MGAIFRASKSKLVRKILEALNEQERLKLCPDNIKKVEEWKKFVKTKTSAKFKAKSAKFKAMRLKQLPQTCSRMGMVQLGFDMKQKSNNSASLSRVKVWIKSRTMKDGKPVNTAVGEVIETLKKIELQSPSSSSSNVNEDALSQVFGQDPKGMIREMGKGMSKTKLSFLQAREKHVS